MKAVGAARPVGGANPTFTDVSGRQRYRLVLVMALSYAAFCSLVLTPLDDLSIYWPYPILIATQSFTGLSTASAYDYIVADSFGLVIVGLAGVGLGRVVGNMRLSWAWAVGVGLWVWVIPLAFSEILIWLVCVNLLGAQTL